MILQEKIRKKAEGFGKLAPVFLEGAEFALENQWIRVQDDLPCNHEELLKPDDKGETSYVIAIINGHIIPSRMYKLNGKWHWAYNKPTYWFPIPKFS